MRYEDSRKAKYAVTSRLACWVAVVVMALTARVSDLAEAQMSPRPAVRIALLDVGQGDAILITTPEGRRVLIDGGPEADAVADLLWDAGVDTLDLVVASHNHADHIGGLPEVFYAFPVRAYIENGLPQPTAVYGRVMDRVEHEPGLRVLKATARSITLGSVTLRVLPPSGLDATQNNNSVGVLLEYGQFRALFTGDSEQPELGRWIADGRAPGVTVVKVAHHGSRNGTTEAWVRATHPAVALISVGEGNRYGHPSPDVERMWAGVAAHVYRTDRDGTIELTATDDGRFTVRTHVRPVAATAR